MDKAAADTSLLHTQASLTAPSQAERFQALDLAALIWRPAPGQPVPPLLYSGPVRITAGARRAEGATRHPLDRTAVRRGPRSPGNGHALFSRAVLA